MHTHPVGNNTPDMPEVFVPSPYIEQVTAALKEAGHERPDAWQQECYLHPDAFKTNDDTIQRFLINRAMRMVLAEVPAGVTTMNERYCLVETGHMEDWLRLMKNEVLPCLVKYNLPLTK